LFPIKGNKGKLINPKLRNGRKKEDINSIKPITERKEEQKTLRSANPSVR